MKLNILIGILALLITGCSALPATYNSGAQLFIEIPDGGSYNLAAARTEKEIDGRTIGMYAYNGVVPGPTLKVAQGSRVRVNFTNELDSETTIHWHGIRHDVKDDGVPGTSQMPVQPNSTHTYNLYFPDSGIFWYHPHVREDLAQEAGLAGNILVIPKNQSLNVNKEEIVAVDDILLDRQGLVQTGVTEPNFVLMGRFGNLMLLNSRTDYSLDAEKGEVIRFYITNMANARPFNISIPGARMKLVGSDLGSFEKEEYIDSLVIAPGERYITDILFEQAGKYPIMNINPKRSYELGTVVVSGNTVNRSYAEEFNMLKDNGKIIDYAGYLAKSPDYELALTVEGLMSGMMGGAMGGMPCHRMPDGTMMGNCGNDGVRGTIEWEDDMQMMNSMSTSKNTKWIIKDERTGKKNSDFNMTADAGDMLKIRIFNDPHSMHPMQHPIHLHGQRFLVLAIDGRAVENHAWKDTVLVPIGSTVDILVDASNPGDWMFHCHISEHLAADMMTFLIVKQASPA